MKLSEHFNLSEFEGSETAEKNGINNKVPAQYISRLIDLCDNVLEPVRKHFGKPVRITSGYRCLNLNRKLGSRDNSQHVLCEAADIVVDGVDPYDVAKYISEYLDFDQVIHEFGRWVHVSYTTRHDLRFDKLTAKKIDGETKYTHGVERA